MIKSENQIFIGILLLGLVIGYLSNYLVSNYIANTQDYEIVYISQNELLQLEQERTASMPIDQQQLFLGKIDKAFEVLQTLAERYESPTSAVIFTDNQANGNNVRSISKEVHLQLLKELSV